MSSGLWVTDQKLRHDVTTKTLGLGVGLSISETIAGSSDRLRYRLRIGNDPKGLRYLSKSYTAYTIRYGSAVRVRYDIEVSLCKKRAGKSIAHWKWCHTARAVIEFERCLRCHRLLLKKYRSRANQARSKSAAQQLVNRLNQGIWGGYRYVLALYLNVAIWLSVGFE